MWGWRSLTHQWKMNVLCKHHFTTPGFSDHAYAAQAHLQRRSFHFRVGSLRKFQSLKCFSYSLSSRTETCYKMRLLISSNNSQKLLCIFSIHFVAVEFVCMGSVGFLEGREQNLQVSHLTNSTYKMFLWRKKKWHKEERVNGFLLFI